MVCYVTTCAWLLARVRATNTGGMSGEKRITKREKRPLIDTNDSFMVGLVLAAVLRSTSC